MQARLSLYEGFSKKLRQFLVPTGSPGKRKKIRNYTIAAMVMSHCRWGFNRKKNEELLVAFSAIAGLEEHLAVVFNGVSAL